METPDKMLLKLACATAFLAFCFNAAFPNTAKAQTAADSSQQRTDVLSPCPDGLPASSQKQAPMPADANPTLTDVTVQWGDSQSGKRLFLWCGGHFFTVNTTLKALIAWAYGLNPRQIVEGPDWAGVDLFDIEGVPDVKGTPNNLQSRMMLQKLLADRFHLAFHREKRELAVYLLRVAKPGEKMARNDSSPDGLPSMFFQGLGRLNVRNASMPELANLMQLAVLDRPLVDHTRLTGRYDFQLRWTPDESQIAQWRSGGGEVRLASENVKAPPSLDVALRRQLGLALVEAEAPEDTIVIEYAVEP